jgi:signal transduction histidine kinase
VPEERLPKPIEAAVYFVTAESLTNVAKYARASAASVRLQEAHETLRLEVADDGDGGADLGGGTGLLGLRDRVEALDGRLTVLSPPGVGTTVIAEIPLEDR